MCGGDLVVRGFPHLKAKESFHCDLVAQFLVHHDPDGPGQGSDAPGLDERLGLGH